MTAPVVFLERKPIRLGKLLAKGGEGEVYLVEGRPDWVLKFYIIENLASRAAKVEAMVRAKLAEKSNLVAYPIAVITDSRNRFAGFVMRMVPGHKEIHQLFGVGDRKANFPSADYRFLTHVALNFARAMADVHARNCVVGDVNSRGILVSDHAMVALIDADSFQITEGSREYPCEVGVPDYTPPELQGRSLSGISRSINHDAFGLGVIVFQILCMGRHPFIGSYANGDMPMEKAIAEHRFAYSTRRSVGMKPPPGTVTLADFPPQIATAFEAAFDPTALRPAAAQWVGLLEEFERSLRRCGLNPLHYYPGAASECPWCRMERVVGITLFLPPAPPAGTIPAAASTTNFNLASIWAAIEAVRLPPSAAPTPLLPTLNIDPSQEALAAAAKSRRQHAWNAILVAASIVGIAGLPPLSIVWLGLGGYNVYRLLGPASAGVQFRKRTTLETQRWAAALADWEKRCGAAEVHSSKKSLATARNQLQALPAELKTRVAAYEANRRDFQLRTHLENHRVGAAKISGVGDRLKLRLIAYGIDSALQVNHGRVLQVDGFGVAKASALMAWRQQVESRFRFDPNPNAADVREKDKINREIALRGDQLRTSLARGARDLTTATQTVLARWKTVDPVLARVYRDRLQAEADEVFVNARFADRIRRFDGATWAILVMALFGALGLFVFLSTHPPQPAKSVETSATQPSLQRFNSPQAFRITRGKRERLVNVHEAPAKASPVLDHLKSGVSIQGVGRVMVPGGGSWIAYQRIDGSLGYVAESVLEIAGAQEIAKSDGGCGAKPWALRRMCEDPSIKSLDDALAVSYRSALRAALPKDKHALVLSERKWIGRRDACQYQPDADVCLIEAYRSRTAELDQIARGSTGTEQPQATTAATGPAQPEPVQVTAPVPRGDLSMIVTSDDYPPAALRAEEAGRVRVRLHVSTSGLIDGCEVSMSSGFNDLDEATCRLMTRRARYYSAKDASGAATDAFVERSVTWTIPQ